MEQSFYQPVELRLDWITSIAIIGVFIERGLALPIESWLILVNLLFRPVQAGVLFGVCNERFDALWPSL